METKCVSDGAANQSVEIYAVIVCLRSGDLLEGYVLRGGDVDSFWLVISRTQDMQNATYINRSEISYFMISDINLTS